MYAIAFGGVVKIGYTTQITNRLRRLEQDTKRKGEILLLLNRFDTNWPLRLEREIHNGLARFEHVGEWYLLSSALLEALPIIAYRTLTRIGGRIG